MTSAKGFTICLLCFLPFAGFAQRGCTDKVTLISVREVSGGGTKIELEVVSKGPFKGKVVSQSNSSEEVIREFSGAGNGRISVDNLDKNSFTSVYVDFDGQKNFLCKSKVLPDIFSTDKP